MRHALRVLAVGAIVAWALLSKTAEAAAVTTFAVWLGLAGCDWVIEVRGRRAVTYRVGKAPQRQPDR